LFRGDRIEGSGDLNRFPKLCGFPQVLRFIPNTGFLPAGSNHQALFAIEGKKKRKEVRKAGFPPQLHGIGESRDGWIDIRPGIPLRGRFPR
jgi:hypothetical protein